MSDGDAVEATIRDYIEGWYTGDAERMSRCLHDNLVKRTLAGDETSGALRELTKQRMVEVTAAGGGEDPAAAGEIVVHDISGDIASGHVLSKEYLDYIHLARTRDGWKITNILFKTRDEAETSS